MAVFNEDTRVKFPAIVQFNRLGYAYQSLKEATIDPSTRIFLERFKKGLAKANDREFEDGEIFELLEEIDELIKRNDLGKAFYHRLIQPQGKVMLINFDDYGKNDFAVTTELTFSPEEGDSFRPDVVPLVNGIPLAFLEVKIPDNSGGIQAEFKRMLDERLRKPELTKFFNMLQIVSFSNNMDYEDTSDALALEEIRAGSFYSTPNGRHTYFNFFREPSDTDIFSNLRDVPSSEVKYILKDNGYSEAEYERDEFQYNLDPRSPCNGFIASLFSIERFMFFLKHGFLYVGCKDAEGNPYVEKHIMRYPQYFAAQGILDRLESGGKSGIIWHTQGSGKTALAAYSARILKDYYAKKNTNVRIFFVVDRLDLMRQSRDELANRGIDVSTVRNRKQFEAELDKPMDDRIEGVDLGHVSVVNVQKIIEQATMPQAKNAYGVPVQRVFFVDEAHRSYKSNGEYFKNLMLCDTDGAYIALTGTPLLSKKERSNLKFGDYIHKYFYDKSIADGYTLRIKRENIDTVRREEIHRNLRLENPDESTDIITDSNAYLIALCKYIESDFKNFRWVNNDGSIGGMIVCSSNPQAKALGSWFEKNSDLSVGVVLSDPKEKMQAARNKELQNSFKYDGVPDILIVHLMLTTGYDVHRLKRMYLLRNAHGQSLLQTISRVNRPYRSPNGKVYEFGYIVDFADIQKEYDRTLTDYIKELENELMGEGDGLAGLVVGPEDIRVRYHEAMDEIAENTDMSHDEVFRSSLLKLDKDKLYAVRKNLRTCVNCYTELRLSHSPYADAIDQPGLKRLQKLVQNRIDILKLQANPTDTLAVIENRDVLTIVYEFIAHNPVILNLGLLHDFEAEDSPANQIAKRVSEIRREVLRNKNRNQSSIVKLDVLLKDIFARLDFKSIDDLAEIDAELAKVYEEMLRINAENERLAARYGGSYAFVKTLTDTCEKFPEFDPSDIESVIASLYESVKDNMERNTLLMQGRANFVTYNQKSIVTEFVKTGLYQKLELGSWLKPLLNDLYTNLQLCN